jgi:hypothetical protein
VHHPQPQFISLLAIFQTVSPLLGGSLSRDLSTTKEIVVNVYSDAALLPEEFAFVFALS